MPKLIDLTGMRFGRLVVQGRNPTNDNNGKPRWDCLCDCGKICTKPGADLKSGAIKSCGCLKKLNRVPDGCRVGHPTHNDTRGKYKRLYGVWSGMKRRCNNPNDKSFKNYGGRGISVCQEWNDDYVVFKRWAIDNGYDLFAKHGECTLDRIDVNGDYCPDNCRWVNAKTQCRNKRNNIHIEDNELGIVTAAEYAETHNMTRTAASYRIAHEIPLDTPKRNINKLWKYNGEEHTLMEWATITGIKYHTLRSRMNNCGWTINEALSTPVGEKRINA